MKNHKYVGDPLCQDHRVDRDGSNEFLLHSANPYPSVDLIAGLFRLVELP